ncbi:MAG: trigger factor [Bacteroidales bacterium]|nr:MAG: trigger factor [Bacteroidales bacterium]
MNITKEHVDELNASIKIKIDKEDYESRVEEVLKDYRKKARIDGFRPGKVPSGLIRKMYGRAILIEEMNKILSESLSRYIQDEKLNILGEPLPNEKEQKTIDWDNQTEFEFVFDLGLAPEFETNLSKKDKIPYYTITIDKKIKNSYREDYTRRFGSFKTVDITNEKEMLKGKIEERDAKGQIVSGGITVEETSFSLELIKDQETIRKFKGKKVNDVVDFNLRKAFPNDIEVASILKTDKDKLENLNPDFRFTIHEISLFENAEINQDLFDKIFGEGIVKSPEEFDKKIEEEISNQFSKESDYRFVIDAREKILQKIKIKLPADFLKRWLYRTNEGKVTMEQVERDYEHFENDLKWQLIKDKIINENGLTVTDDEVLDYAKEVAMMQFQQYGMVNLPEDYLTNYAKEILKKEDESKKIYERKYEQKVIEFIRENVKVDEKKVSSEEFNKLYDKDKQS